MQIIVYEYQGHQGEYYATRSVGGRSWAVMFEHTIKKIIEITGGDMAKMEEEAIRQAKAMGIPAVIGLYK